MTVGSVRHNEFSVSRIASLRLSVGLLGERDNAGWWTSGFMSPTSAAFMTPVFGVRTLQARYQGVLEAARRVHDEHIGVGRAFHLFRLPEAIEQRIFDVVQLAAPQLSEPVSSPEAAKATLAEIAGHPAEAKEGPAMMGTVDLLGDAVWVAEAAALYSAAFVAGIQCFPYFSGGR